MEKAKAQAKRDASVNSLGWGTVSRAAAHLKLQVILPQKHVRSQKSQLALLKKVRK